MNLRGYCAYAFEWAMQNREGAAGDHPFFPTARIPREAVDKEEVNHTKSDHQSDEEEEDRAPQLPASCSDFYQQKPFRLDDGRACLRLHFSERNRTVAFGRSRNVMRLFVGRLARKRRRGAEVGGGLQTEQ